MPTKVRTKKKPEEPGRGTPAYMLTFGDMTCLLMVFFIALLKLDENVSSAKSIAALQSFRPGISVLSGSVSVLDPSQALFIPDKTQTGPKYGDATRISKLREAIQADVTKVVEQGKETKTGKGPLGAKGDVSVEVVEGGIKIRLASNILFDLGSADLRGEALNVVGEIGQFAKENHMEVTVEGHTDKRPISTAQYPSNWELSAARATQVVRHMLHTTGMAPTTMTAIGRGEFFPRCTSDESEECFQKNRRIEILLRPTELTPGGSQNKATELFGEGGLGGPD